MDVGVRELKARLSEYLERAGRGELIRVTDRGVPKAILGPLPGRVRIDEGVEDGWLRSGSGASVRPVARVRGHMRSEQALLEDRGE